MILNKNLPFNALLLWAITTFWSAVMASEIMARDCSPATITLVVQVVYTSTGVSVLPTATVTKTVTSSFGFSAVSVTAGSGSGATNAGGSANMCPTSTQYSLAIITLGALDTVTQTVTTTVSAAATSSLASPTVTGPVATSSLSTNFGVTSSTVAGSSAAGSSASGSSAAGSPVSTSSASGSSVNSAVTTSSGSATTSSGSASAVTTSSASSSTSSHSSQSATTSSAAQPSFYLQASGATGTNLVRSNDEYARLFVASGVTNLDFALSATTSANHFYLDSQSRLVDVASGAFATTTTGGLQKVNFYTASNVPSGSVALTCSTASQVLKCTGNTGITSLTTQKDIVLCYGSTDTTTAGANGKFYMTSDITPYIVSCSSVTVKVVSGI